MNSERRKKKYRWKIAFIVMLMFLVGFIAGSIFYGEVLATEFPVSMNGGVLTSC